MSFSLRLFKEQHEALLSHDEETAYLVSQHILRGEQKDIEHTVSLIRNYPSILRTRVTVKDLLGRSVEGRPLEIAVMAGEDIETIKKIIAAGNLTQAEISEQLRCITAAPEAKVKNDYIFQCIEKFMESILSARKIYRSRERGGSIFVEYPEIDLEATYGNAIIEFRKSLFSCTRQVTKMGYIFDPSILYRAAALYHNYCKEERLDHWSYAADVFWTYGIGGLQSQLSSRWAQVILGPNWTRSFSLKNVDGLDFYDPASKFGKDFYIGQLPIMLLSGQRDKENTEATCNSSAPPSLN